MTGSPMAHPPMPDQAMTDPAMAHPPMTDPAIVFENAGVHVLDPAADRRPDEATSRTILSDVSCTLTEPTVTVIGANGSGKSTLLQLINGLIPVDEGRVMVDGLDVADRGREVRRRVGFVFTDPAAQLVMPTPLEDVELSLKHLVRDKRERRTRALAVLDELGVADLAERSVYELSGGQRQLVALATVLAVDPAVLVLDEPTTLLDLANREKLRGVLADLVSRRGLRTILSTHDLEVAQDAERTLLIHHGRLHADGAPAEVVAAYRAVVAEESRAVESGAPRARE